MKVDMQFLNVSIARKCPAKYRGCEVAKELQQRHNISFKQKKEENLQDLTRI